MKLVLVVFIALIAVAYSGHPNAFRPWKDVLGHVSADVANVVKKTGEATNNFLHETEHENIVIEKTKEAVSGAGNSKQAGTGI